MSPIKAPKAPKLEGDVCHLCAEERIKAGLEPRQLVLLGITKRRKLEVRICPHCDTKADNNGEI